MNGLPPPIVPPKYIPPGGVLGFNLEDVPRVERVRPIDDRVFVRPSTLDEKTDGGLVLPDVARGEAAQQRQMARRGRVVAVGPGRLLKDGTRAPVSVREGDEVLWRTWGDVRSVVKVTVNGEELLSMPEEQLLGVVEST